MIGQGGVGCEPVVIARTSVASLTVSLGWRGIDTFQVQTLVDLMPYLEGVHSLPRFRDPAPASGPKKAQSIFSCFCGSPQVQDAIFGTAVQLCLPKAANLLPLPCVLGALASARRVILGKCNLLS